MWALDPNVNPFAIALVRTLGIGIFIFGFLLLVEPVANSLSAERVYA